MLEGAELVVWGECYEYYGLWGGGSRWVVVVCKHVHWVKGEELGDVFLCCVV